MGPILRKDETSEIDKLGPRFQHLGPSLRKDERSTIDKLGPSFLELEPSLRKDDTHLCFAMSIVALERCGPCKHQLALRGFIELASVMINIVATHAF